MRLSVIVPVYNGANYIAANVKALQDYLSHHIPESEIILVDDGSSDGTAVCLKALESTHVKVQAHVVNLGKWAAIKTGMSVAQGSCRLFTDADLPYELEAIPYIESLVNSRQFHLVVGDRTLAGSEYHESLNWIRRIATSAFSHLVRVFVTGGLFDTQCGLKALRSDVAEAVFPLLRDQGFSGDVELLYIALKYNLEIKRIPVRLRRSAPSSVDVVTHGGKMLSRIMSLRRGWRSGLYKSPQLAALTTQAYWRK